MRFAWEGCIFLKKTTKRCGSGDHAMHHSHTVCSLFFRKSTPPIHNARFFVFPASASLSQPQPATASFSQPQPASASLSPLPPVWSGDSGFFSGPGSWNFLDHRLPSSRDLAEASSLFAAASCPSCAYCPLRRLHWLSTWAPSYLTAHNKSKTLVNTRTKFEPHLL